MGARAPSWGRCVRGKRWASATVSGLANNGSPLLLETASISPRSSLAMPEREALESAWRRAAGAEPIKRQPYSQRAQAHDHRLCTAPRSSGLSCRSAPGSCDRRPCSKRPRIGAFSSRAVQVHAGRALREETPESPGREGGEATAWLADGAKEPRFRARIVSRSLGYGASFARRRRARRFAFVICPSTRRRSARYPRR